MPQIASSKPRSPSTRSCLPRSSAALAYDRSGSGEPLVLIHPLGADRRIWDPVLPSLRGSRDVIAVDLPGFGESPAIVEEQPTPARLARAVIELLRELDLDGGRAHVAGNSLGGWVALEIASLGEAASVTAIAPAGLWPRALVPKPEVARTVARALAPAISALMRLAPFRQIAMAGIVAHPERVTAAQAAALIRAYANATGFTAANRAMRAGRFVQLAEIDVPVTLVWPERDRLIAPLRAVPEGVRQERLADCGHLPMFDDPKLVADVLRRSSAVQGHR
ncbi:MAG: alpha/beta fold hydrolase [Solirubrobacteraceae bacterium]